MTRDLNVDRLRGLGILLVLGLHFFDLWFYVNEIGQDGRPVAARLFGHGYFGVTIFFVVSGYLIASTSVQTDMRRLRVDVPRFYARRVTRILPLLVASLALGALVLNFAAAPENRSYQYLFHVPGAVFTPGMWLSIAAFSFNWFRSLAGGATHGWFGLQWDVLWSLSVEEQFYLVFPWLIGWCGTLSRTRTALVVITVVCAGLRFGMVAFGSAWLGTLANSTLCFDALALGVLVALSKPWSGRASVLGAAGGAVVLLLGYLCGVLVLGGIATLAIALGTALLIQAGRGRERRASGYEPVLPAMGRLSYGLYLLHPLVFFGLCQLHILTLNVGIAFALSLIACFLVAKASFDAFERPVERLLRSRLYARLDRARSTGQTTPLGDPAIERRP